MAQVGMDYYEDMFKEITKKLYGEEDLETGEAIRMMQGYDGVDESHGTLTAFSLAALMQSGFPSTSFITNPSILESAMELDENKWVQSDEVLPWTTSKIASYNSVQKLFRCNECECVGFLSRIAEHWLGTHANLRVFQCPQCPYASAWARCVRMHLARQHNICPDQNADSLLWKENPVLEEVTKYLQRLKSKIDDEDQSNLVPVIDTPTTVKNESQSVIKGSLQNVSTTQTVQVAQTVQAAQVTQGVKHEQVQTIQPVVKQEIEEYKPSEQLLITQPKVQQTNLESAQVTTLPKRYNCTFCPYATDRRDLYTRHENIHKEEKPFQCYVCSKQFNRADHVKKHFLRMHREHAYDIHRIRRDVSKSGNSNQTHYFSKPLEPAQISLQIPISQLSQLQNVTDIQHVLQNGLSIPTSLGLDKNKLPRPRKPGEKRYSCCYCSWSGVDNWCLKRHLNTHTKPFNCSLCEYKAARAERLATHVLKVHNKRACSRCNFLAEDSTQLSIHQQQQHHNLSEEKLTMRNDSLNNSSHHNHAQSYPFQDPQKCAQRNCPPRLIPIHELKLSDSFDFHCQANTMEADSKKGCSNENEVTLKCNDCSFSTTSLKNLMRHNCQFQCRLSPSCDKMFYLPVQTVLEEESTPINLIENREEYSSNLSFFNEKFQSEEELLCNNNNNNNNKNNNSNNIISMKKNKKCTKLEKQLFKILKNHYKGKKSFVEIVKKTLKLKKKVIKSAYSSNRIYVKLKNCSKFQLKITGKYLTGLRCYECCKKKCNPLRYQNLARLLLHGLVAHSKYLYF